MDLGRLMLNNGYWPLQAQHCEFNLTRFLYFQQTEQNRVNDYCWEMLFD